MKHTTLISSLGIAVLVALSAFVAQAAPQFHRGTAKTSVDVSTYPPDIQHGYRVFTDKCSECHDLKASLAQTRSPAGWTSEVRRMQDMASSHIDDREADEIARFLTYYDSHKPAEQNSAVSPGAIPAVSGKELFAKDSCSACHSVAGEGNTSFPLDGIGSRMTATELKKQIVSPASGSSMPPTVAPDDEIDALVAYLVTLKTR
jgi:mono/diheme cytochrome c family protein